MTGRTVPEIGNNLVAAISLLLVLLGRSFGDLEAIRREQRIARMRAASDLAAIQAIAEDLQDPSESAGHPSNQ